jgi:uncharacterized repeat protein (TIGR02543 family)
MRGRLSAAIFVFALFASCRNPWFQFQSDDDDTEKTDLPTYAVTVTFNGNGNTGGTAPTAMTANAGASITLPAKGTLARTNFAFDGWNTKADGTGTNHSADSSYTVTADITLYAHWIVIPPGSFSVIFDSNDGSSVETEIVVSGGKATRPTNPTRSDYTFDNWYSNTALTAVYDFNTPVTANITLYAKWSHINHQWGVWTITTPATETTNGVETRTCTVCGETETRIAYATGTEGLSYALLNGNAYSVIAVPVTSVEVHIPAYRLNNGNYVPVTSISDDAFLNLTNLTSVNIPEGVTSIGDSAFASCSSLESITIPEGVTMINNSAFRDCSSLTSVTIPSSVTMINNSTFDGCSSLTSIVIPTSVTSIGDRAFRDCSSLESITIPEGVTSIGDSAFRDCSSLTSVTIPSSVTMINNSAFYGCYILTSIKIPASVTSIGDSAFRGCSSLTSVTIPSSVTMINNSAFYGCSSLTSITIPASVTMINNSAFFGCSSLTSITIPASVTTIDNFAFYACTSLTSITIPASVTSIGDGAFDYCISLTSVTFEGTIASDSFGSNAFDGDLVAKYLGSGGGAGTYTRPNGTSNSWEKQP